MIDTNQINQAGEVVQAVKAQVTYNWPAICAVCALLARELRNLNAWLFQAAEFVIKHGGMVMIGKKLIWNPGFNAEAQRRGDANKN